MYKKDGYLLRAAAIQWIDRALYQPYHDSCHRMVWEKFGYQIYFYTYQTFLNYLKVKIPPNSDNPPPAIDGLLKTMDNGNGFKSLALSYLRSVQACVEKLIRLILAADDFSPEAEAEYRRSIEREHKAELRAQSAQRKAYKRKKQLAGSRPADTIMRPSKDMPKTIRRSQVHSKAKGTTGTARSRTDTEAGFTLPPLPSTSSVTERAAYTLRFYNTTTTTTPPSIRPVPDLIPDFRLPSPQPDAPFQTSLPSITAAPLCDKTGTLTVPLRAPMARAYTPLPSFQPLRPTSTACMPAIRTRGAPAIPLCLAAA